MSNTHEGEKERLVRLFEERFGPGGDIRVYFAPGRVNLIGEHTDYNGGAAMPGAIGMGTYFVVRTRDDRKLRMYSENFEGDGILEGSLDELVYKPEAGWSNYPKGVMWAFQEKGREIPQGMDLLLSGTLPNGAGLSSSASVEVGTGLMLADLFGFNVSNEELALTGQYAENNFCGVNCGIMDQFAIAMGKDNEAIFLNTSPLTFSYVPFHPEDATIVIASSNKKRGLNESKYNERRAQCEMALSDLQKELDIQSLGDLTEEEFEKNAHLIDSEVCRRRARHAVSENQRTIHAREALEKGDLEEFGRLMKASHDSLRDDYEVTGRELDTLYDLACAQEGVLGVRMTGAGFGGCTVNLVRNENLDAFMENVGRGYEEEIGYAADFYPVTIGSSPTRI